MDGQISFCAFVHGVALVHWIRSPSVDREGGPLLIRSILEKQHTVTGVQDLIC
jgi:hypothetical protein